jgi:hypothetical protein
MTDCKEKPCQEKPCSLNCNGTCTTTPEPANRPFSLEVLEAAIRSLPPKQPIRKFYASKSILPTDCFKIEKKSIPQLNFFNSVDKNVDVLYICGSVVRDALIEKGIKFENY